VGVHRLGEDVVLTQYVEGCSAALLAFEESRDMPAGSRRTPAQTRRTPRQDRSRATIEYLLEAAAQVFGARGYAATTNEIAARAGVSIGTLYQYFADKDALLLALAERHLDHARQRLLAALQEPDAASDRSWLVRTTIETVVEVNRPSALHELLYTSAPRTPQLVAVLDRLRDDMAAAVAALLVADGAEEVVAMRRAKALVIAIDAGVHEHVLAASSSDDERARIDDLVRLAIATLAAYAEDPGPAAVTGARDQPPPIDGLRQAANGAGLLPGEP
jgi:AcrR family transcriptional regulator